MSKVLSVVGILLLGASVAVAQKSEADLDKKELATIAAKEKKLVSARKGFFKDTKSVKAKKFYVNSAFDLAEFVLVTPALPAKEKYPRALRLYREVLRVDPSHKKSLEKSSLIESIYKSMGRKIPD